MCMNHSNLGRKWKGEERLGRGGEEKEVVCILPDTQTQKEKKTKEDQLLDLQLVSLISERLPLSSEKIQHL